MALGDTLKNYTVGVGIKDNNFTAGLKNMGSQLKSFVSQMGIMLGAGSLGLAFKKFIDAGTDISNFSSLTGIAEQDITALGGALEQFGGNVDSAKSSLQALQQGKTNIKALLEEQQKMGAMNAQQAMEAKKFSIEWTKLKQSLSNLGRSIAVDIMPPVIDFVKQLGKAVDWVRSLDTYTIMLAASFGVVGYAIKNLQSVMTIFSKSFLKANLPLLALITGLTILFLIVEDIVGYFNGKESLFGKFLENEKIQEFVQKIQGAFSWIKDLVSGFSFDGLLEKINNMADAIKNVFVGTFDYVKDVIATIGANLGAFIVNPLIDVLNELPFIDLELKKLDTKAMPVYSDYIKGNSENNNTQNNNITINMPGGTDSLTNITNAVETGINKANSVSPALLVNDEE